MKLEQNEPNLPCPTTRHDGWTGEVMAKFLEALAETGIVMDACDAARKSRTTAYELRRRNPLFAKAWELALGNARDRLADTLLARSLEGNVEQIIKDGEIVAEKHFIDNRLGLAILKRLDKLAEGPGAMTRTHRPPHGAGSGSWGPGQRGYAASQRLGSGVRQKTDEPDWDIALTALRTGDADDIAAALAMLQHDEADKADTPPFGELEGDSFDHPRIWREWQTEEWRTNYPPPPGFSGFEQGDWEDENYCRALSEEELAALIASGIAEPLEQAVSIEEDEAGRHAFFSQLVAQNEACPRHSPA